MNYNLRVEMERVNGKVVTQVEVSGVGRAGRERFDSPDFDSALVTLKETHDKLLGGVSQYHTNSQPAPDPAPEPKKVKDVQAAKPKAADPKKPDGVVAKAKAAARKFAKPKD